MIICFQTKVLLLAEGVEIFLVLMIVYYILYLVPAVVTRTETNLMFLHRHPIRMQGNTSQFITIADNPTLTLHNSVADCAGLCGEQEKLSVL